MGSEHYEGLSAGERMGCGVAGLIAIPWFMWLGLVEMLTAEFSPTNGFFLNAALPTTVISALVFFGVRNLVDTMRVKRSRVWWAASAFVVLLLVSLYPAGMLIWVMTIS